MIYAGLRSAMIYQVCDLDKENPHQIRMRVFLVETSGFCYSSDGRDE